MNNYYQCANQFPNRFCHRQTSCPCPINPNPIYGGCTDCLTYSSIPTECPCPGVPGCYKLASIPEMNKDIYVNWGQSCNCPRKPRGKLGPCPRCPKVHYLQTYGRLPPPSQLVPGYLNQGSDGNFKTRWLNVSWGDLLGCANKFHMKGLKLKDSMIRHKECDDLCSCCCNNLNRGERLRIICDGKRLYGAGDEFLHCQTLQQNARQPKCSPCNCYDCPVRPIVRNCCPSSC